MAKYELLQAMKDHSTTAWLTAKEWGDALGYSVSAATLTSLVSEGRIVRTRWVSTEPYSYRALSQQELQEARKQEEKEREMRYKRSLVENYESNKEWDLRRIEEIKEKAEKEIQTIKNAMEKEAQLYIQYKAELGIE